MTDDAADVRDILRDRWNLRLEHEMSQYVLRRLRQGQTGPLPVMGGDARTGRPVLVSVPLDQLARAATPAPPPPAAAAFPASHA